MKFDFFFYIRRIILNLIYDFGIVYVGCNMYGRFPFNFQIFIIIFIILTVIDICSDVLFYVLAKKLSKKKEAEENVPSEPEPETSESEVQDETSYS